MSNLPASIRQAIEVHLGEKLKTKVVVSGYSAVAGGCINNGGRIDTSCGSYFAKWNDRNKYPDMFAKEAAGLKLLSEAGAIRIPMVIFDGAAEAYQFLVLEYIETGPRRTDFFAEAARQLAALHRNTHTSFGWSESNYMGSLVQDNKECDSWIEFFVERRLNPQLRVCIDQGMLGKETIRIFERLYAELPSILYQETPTLVHGDLWSGNMMCDEKGSPCLIDPAVYFGHREVDLAMTKLFGGFDDSFYSCYQDVLATPPGLSQRLDIYNLYPLLVHVNLFGGGYASQVLAILRPFR